MNNFYGKLKKFIHLPFNEKLLFMEAIFIQYMVCLFLKLIPFKWIPVLLKNPEKHVSNPDIALLRQIKSAIKYAGHLAIWKNKCLIMSLTARLMLKKRNIPSQLFFGVEISQKKQFTAHAWIQAGNYEMVNKNGEWKELYSF
ncbi:MAG: lasso peptide biosynthesis B2 protein [Prolixibacteraceae bacterium]|jgi:hypothetical protein|nr:lasso peptide biosynthesis B2 protein [Prolixibacteraceae bacterium]HQJ86791.1 lasso peptide biosynthesis B2 protein [Prolixibacteraceae bacterium]